MIITTTLYSPNKDSSLGYAITCRRTIEQTLIECIKRQSDESLRSSGVVKYPNDTVYWKTNFFCVDTKETSEQGVFIHIVVYCRDPQEIRKVFKRCSNHFLEEIKSSSYLNQEYRKGYPPRILVEFIDSESCVVI